MAEHRVQVLPTTITVLGRNVKETSPAWNGLFLDRAVQRTRSTIAMVMFGKDAPVDIHLDVPWCHPGERTGTEDDWNDCVYRVRPKREIGQKWRGKPITGVRFEQVEGAWWIVYET